MVVKCPNCQGEMQEIEAQQTYYCEACDKVLWRNHTGRLIDVPEDEIEYWVRYKKLTGPALLGSCLGAIIVCCTIFYGTLWALWQGISWLVSR